MSPKSTKKRSSTMAKPSSFVFYEGTPKWIRGMEHQKPNFLRDKIVYPAYSTFSKNPIYRWSRGAPPPPKK